MYSIYPQKTISTTSAVRTFQRREYLPMIRDILWQIDSGMVRTITVDRNDTVTTLGLWSVGDVVGYPLAGIDDYQIQCLSDVRLHRLRVDDCLFFNRVLLSHLHQSQVLLRIRHGFREDRLKKFLTFLAKEFGQSTESGYYIPHSLSHQNVAEAIDSNRVTVTRYLGQLEQQGIIHWSRTSCFLYHNSQKQFLLNLA